MNELIKHKTFLVIGASVLVVFILLFSSLYKEAVIFWTAVSIGILVFKKSIVWIIYLLIINIFLFPTGGDFEESRLFSIFGLPITTEKFLIIISPLFLLSENIKSLPGILKNYSKNTKLFIENNLTIFLMAFFVLISLISIVISPVEIQELRIALITLGFVLFFVTNFGFKTKNDIKAGAIILAVGIILVSLYGLYEFSIEKNILENSTGFKPFPTGDIYRIKSVQGLPLVLSSLINLIFPLVLVLALYFKRNYVKFFFISGLIILTLTQILSFTRSGWIVMTLEIIALGILLRKEVRSLFLGVVRAVPKGLLTGGAIVLVTFIYIISVNLITFVDFRITTDSSPVSSVSRTTGQEKKVNYGRSNVTSLESRLQALELGRRVIFERPILGVGLGGFSGAVEKYGDDLDVLKKFSAADNSYTMLLTETGLLGFFSFMSILFMVLLKTFKTYVATKDLFFKKLMLAIFIAQIGVVIQSGGFEIFSYAHNMFIFWILSGFVFAYHRMEFSKYGK